MASPKAVVRAEALGRRRLVDVETRAALAAALAAAGPDLVRRFRPAAAASAFHPIRDEPDTLPLLRALAGAGIATALPVTPPRGRPMRFRAWRAGEALRPGPFGTAEPSPEAAEMEPDVLFVPLAAFDRRGGRVGYGAGHYDGALARLRASKRVLAIGVAFAVQEVGRVPTESHDEPLDAVLTEHGLLAFGG